MNMMSEWFLEAANHTCGNYDRGVNEIELAGLTPVPSIRVSTMLRDMHSRRTGPVVLNACERCAC